MKRLKTVDTNFEWEQVHGMFYTGCGRNNSHILKGNKNQTKQGTKKKLFHL